MVEASDEIFTGGKVGAGFAADRGVDLGEEGGGDLDVVDAAHVDGGEETGEVADDAAAERDKDRGAVGAGFGEFCGKAFDLAEALKALTGGEEEGGGLLVFGESCEEFRAPERPYFRRGNNGIGRAAEALGAGNSGKQTAADEDGVIGGGGFDLDCWHKSVQGTGYSGKRSASAWVAYTAGCCGGRKRMIVCERVRAVGQDAVRVVATVLLVSGMTGFAQMPGQKLPGLPQITVEQTEHGLRAHVGQEVVEVTVCGDAVIHVVASPEGPAPEHAKPWMLEAKEACPGAAFTFAQNNEAATVTTAQLKVGFSLGRGNLSFENAAGDSILREGNAIPRTYEPTEENGEKTWRITDRFSLDATEAVYGLGQHQSGLFNYRGATVELGQNNTDIAIPVLVSTRGYGILWNTAA